MKGSLSFSLRRVQGFGLSAILACSTQVLASEPQARDSFYWSQSSAFSESEALTEGRALISQKKWPEAVVALRKAAERPGASLESVALLSAALTRTGRRAEALSALRAAAEREPKEVKKKELLARARVLSQTFLTNGCFQLYQDGLELLQVRKTRLSCEKLKQAQDKEPDNAAIIMRLAQCQVLEAEEDSALEHLRLARSLLDEEPQIPLWMGRAYHQRGEFKSALIELRSAYKAQPRSEQTVMWLAETLVAHGDSAGALHVLEDHVRANPMHVGALTQSVRVRMGLGRTDTTSLWGIRKDIQLGMSRLSGYFKDQKPGPSELELRDLVVEGALRSDLDKLLQQVEARIEKRDQPNKTDS